MDYASRRTDGQTVLSTMHGRWLIPSLKFCIYDYRSVEEKYFYVQYVVTDGSQCSPVKCLQMAPRITDPSANKPPNFHSK